MADAVAQGDRNRREASLVPSPVNKTVKDKKYNETYTIGKCIGKGGFSWCYEARSEKKGTICCKVVWRGMLIDRTEKDRMKSEVAIHRKMKHPNIVRYKRAFEDEDYVYIMMELCRRGSLKELIDRRKSLTEPEVRYYALQLLGMLEYLKEKRVIHRDLKLANVFISDDMTHRLGDFGLARQLSDDGDRRRTQCGTPNYTAPEVLNDAGHSYEVDMWAFGIILYTLLVGIPPFQAESLYATCCKIQALDMSFPDDARISDEAKDIIRLILQANPDDRPSIEQVRQHPFFNGYTPHTLSSDALHSVPQFSADSEARDALHSVPQFSADSEARDALHSVLQSTTDTKAKDVLNSVLQSTTDTKARDALHSAPQFTTDTKASLKRSFNRDAFSYPSLIPGPSKPHKKAQTKARDALHSVPQLTADTKASLKRSLDRVVLSRPSLIPGLSTLHKKAQFGQSPRIVPPVPLPPLLNSVRRN